MRIETRSQKESFEQSEIRNRAHMTLTKQIKIKICILLLKSLCISNICCTFVAKLGNMAILTVILLVAAAVVLLCVGVILRKDHSFRSQHIHQNERMKKDGIHCAISEDAIDRKKKKKIIKIDD